MRQQIRIKIWKLQRPAVYLGSGPFYVVAYDRYRNDQVNMEITDQLLEMFDDKFDIYVKGYLDQQGNLNILEQVEKPRGW